MSSWLELAFFFGDLSWENLPVFGVECLQKISRKGRHSENKSLQQKFEEIILLFLNFFFLGLVFRMSALFFWDFWKSHRMTISSQL